MLSTKKRLCTLLLVALLAMGVLTPLTLRVQGESVIVQEGDVLWRIARAHGLTYQELAHYNNLPNPHFIRVGQELRIPGMGGGDVMLANFPFIPDFLAISEYGVLFDSGDAAHFDIRPHETGYDLIQYLLWYDVPPPVILYEVEKYLNLLNSHGFIRQRVEESPSEITYFYFNQAHTTSLFIHVSPTFGELDILILRDNFYAEVDALWEEWTGAFIGDWDDDWVPHFDPDVVGAWALYATYNEQNVVFADLIITGDVFYVFRPDGTGYWGAMDENETLTHLVTLIWETYDGILYIDFPTIDFYGEYAYEVRDGNLYLTHDIAWHILTPAPREFEVRALFAPPQPWLRNTAVANHWQFYETNSWLYTLLMDFGPVIYQFNEDGTGYWGGAAVNEGVDFDIPLYWWTQDDVLTISFPSIYLLLVYYFDVPPGPEHSLFLSNRFNDDEHRLVPVA
ncbi:MAG: LysM peptidoglycan-binding domain-containing protein [Defluviitaleaceae bacterium]|nr:LysM peptidoglycan-binding domain-containing protein [Defluviitaleaceae bacterium]